MYLALILKFVNGSIVIVKMKVVEVILLKVEVVEVILPKEEVVEVILKEKEREINKRQQDGVCKLNKHPSRIASVCISRNNVPDTFVIANCEVVKPRVAAAEHISLFNEEVRSPFVKKYKTISHPKEVNRIRELPQNSKIVATHTDSPDVLIWDVETQPNRHAVLGAANSRLDLILAGHTDNAEFALAICPAEPFVLSGGKDRSVVFWSIQDHITTVGSDSKSSESIMKQTGEGGDKPESPSVGSRGVYHGHDDTVKDVAFSRTSAQEFCSVGDDSYLILWDARTGTNPVTKVEKTRDADLHCVDWNPHKDNLILTGSADDTVRLYDRRNLTSNGAGTPIYKFEGHKAAVLCDQWSPDKSSVFGSSAEEGLLNIWDQRVSKKSDRAAKSPTGLFFQHAVTGTKWLISTGMRQTLGLLVVFLLTVRLLVEGEHCRSGG